MKDKKIVLDIPKEMEVDIEKSDLKAGIIKLRKRVIGYMDAISALADEYIRPACIQVSYMNVDKLIALSRLMIIAKYYNRDWKPDWNSNE